MNNLSRIPIFVWRLLFAAALVAVALLTEVRASNNPGMQNSWIFSKSRFSHDPDTGARVSQYAMKPPIEALPDPRDITSGYSRTRTVLRGADGSSNTYYRVQSYGNGRGGIDAEWERFHDAWRGSRTSGGSYQGIPPYGFGGGFGGYGSGYGAGYSNGGGSYPGYGNVGPGYGNVGPGYGGGGFGQGGGFRSGAGYGPGYGRPDAGLLDPDAADGYPSRRRRVPDREFFNQPQAGHSHAQ